MRFCVSDAFSILGFVDGIENVYMVIVGNCWGIFWLFVVGEIIVDFIMKGKSLIDIKLFLLM